jgi:hypothetical protein
MTWTIEIIKARFIEAADIERRMLVKGMSGGGNAWPTYGYDEEDRKGWVQEDIDAEKERWSRNKTTATPEITRWEEVFFEWTALIPESRRVLVWRWAQCRASGRSFSEWCERKGVIRMTAYNRLDKVCGDLEARFRLEARLLRLPDEKWHLQQEADQASTAHTMGEAANDNIKPKLDAANDNAKPVTRRHEPFRSEKHHDALTTPEAVAAFAQHLADVNEQRRKARLRKALRGVPGEPAGGDEEAA